MATLASPSYVQLLVPARRSRPAPAPLGIAAVLLFWWLFHIGSFFYSGTSPAQALQATDDGSVMNRVQIGLLGFLGLTAIVPALKALRRARCGWPYWFLAYLGWSATTLLWSSSPELGIRRFLSLLLVSIGAIGIGGGYYGRAALSPLLLLKHLRLAGAIAVLFCLPL